MSVSARVAVEIFQAHPVGHRAGNVFISLAAAAEPFGIDIVWTDTYRGDSEWLLLWGPGAPNRSGVMAQHVAKGGRVIAWDLAYWRRDVKNRVSIDAAHPQQWVMRQAFSSTRVEADRIHIANKWNQNGPIVIAGIGQKATVQYGEIVKRWETEIVAACKPFGRPILYRPKRDHHVPAGAKRAPSGDIDAVLSGASLVCTWHSNVAVDAIRLGIPVVCRDGAAAAVAHLAVKERLTPLEPAVRDQFLANLAHFQWMPSEGAACWKFLLELLS